FAAPAELTLAAVPMTVAANSGDCLDYGAIRERLGQVAETFSRATAGFPDPMQADEAAAILAITDAEIEEGQAVVEFGLRWGMSLDWLFFGHMTALLIDSRRANERHEAKFNDPAVAAYREWRETTARLRPVIDAYASMHPEDPGADEAEAAQIAAIDECLEALLRVSGAEATSLEGVRGQLIAIADAGWGLKRHGNPDSIADYGWTSHDGRGSVIELQALFSAYASVARWAGHPTAQAALDAKSAIHVEDDEAGA
ncbi:MAG: hypothetical protein AAFV01_14980, partial [Bacteroidota bacterium]